MNGTEPYRLQDELLLALEVLSPLETDVIFRRFGLDRDEESTDQVALALGRSADGVLQIERTACDKLRQAMTDAIKEPSLH